MNGIVVIYGFFFLSKVANPDFDPRNDGAPSVYTPVNVDQESFDCMYVYIYIYSYW